MRIGKIIRKYRIERGMSMGDFAKMSGISKPYVSMLEANKNSRDGEKLITLNSITEDNEEIKLLSKICAGNVGTAEKLNEEIFKAGQNR